MKGEMKELRGKIKEKDLENIAAIKHDNLRYLVAYDEDYEEAGVEEYITPKEFIKLFELEPYEKEY